MLRSDLGTALVSCIGENARETFSLYVLEFFGAQPKSAEGATSRDPGKSWSMSFVAVLRQSNVMVDARTTI